MTPLDAAQADLDAVEAIVRAAGTSFYRGMRVLPPDRRHAMYAIYAFCRMVDDIADEDSAFAAKLPELTAWRERVAGLYQGQSDGPVTRILARRRAALRASAAGLPGGDRRHADGRREHHRRTRSGDARSLLRPGRRCRRPALGARLRRCLGRSGRGGVCARPRAATHQHPARPAGGRGAWPALSAARMARRRRRAARSGGGAARARSPPGLCAGRRPGAPALPHRGGGDAPLRRPGDEAGAADGRHLCGDPVAAGAPRLGAAAAAREPAGLAEAVARTALRPRCRRVGAGPDGGGQCAGD